MPKLGSDVSLKIAKPLLERVSSITTSTVIEVTQAGIGSKIQSSAAKMKSAITRCCVVGKSAGNPKKVGGTSQANTKSRQQHKKIRICRQPVRRFFESSPKKYRPIPSTILFILFTIVFRYIVQVSTYFLNKSEIMCVVERNMNFCISVSRRCYN